MHRYRAYLLWGSVADTCFWRSKKQNKKIALKWCLRFDTTIEKRVRDGDSHLLTCIVLFTNSQSTRMIPPFQDASWCLQGWQIRGWEEVVAKKSMNSWVSWCCILQSHCFRNEVTTNWLQFWLHCFIKTVTGRRKIPKRRQNQLEIKKCLEKDRQNRWEFLCLYWRKITQEMIKKTPTYQLMANWKVKQKFL